MRPASSKKEKVKNYKAKNPRGESIKEPGIAYVSAPLNLVVNFLGGKQALRGNKIPESDFEYMELINAGLPKLSFDHLQSITGLSINEMANVFNITDRTLRRYTSSTILGREQSERAIEIARLYSRGKEVFKDLDFFREWMDSSIPALGGKKPKSYLGTSIGINLLLKTLGRIEHGVYS